MDPIFSLVFKGILIIGTVVGVFFSHRYFKAKQDNPIEKIVEDVVKQQTGVDVDSIEKEFEANSPSNDSDKK